MIHHGGNLAAAAQIAGCAPGELLDFSVNLHVDGIPDGLFQVCFRALDELSPYPEAHASALSSLAAAKWKLQPEQILFGNGSSELLALVTGKFARRRAVIVTPGYLEYANFAQINGMEICSVALAEADDFAPDLPRLAAVLLPGDLVMMGNPGNPAGQCVKAADWHCFIAGHPEVTFLTDEAFADFSNETLLRLPLLPNSLILRSMTKYYAIAGLRLGYLVGPEAAVADLAAGQIPWSVGTVAARAAAWLLTRRDLPDHVTPGLRETLTADLRKLALKVYPSAANYLLVRTPRPLYRALLQHKILVRDCSNYPGLDDSFIRIAVRNEEDNRRLLNAFNAILQTNLPVIAAKRRTPAIMFQGTSSNAGKSVLTAAFCRILLEDGYRVAPFKAQNMALNSFVTFDGGEIGRAQAVQAEACRLDPDVRMNPILLKPNSDTGSQVIVHGHAIGNFKAVDYFAKKRELWGEVTRAYDSLAADFECIVLEGAGSPGEINLKSADIVNMHMAEYAKSPVLLVGDIDRGGVYASFIGTYATLTYRERQLLAGFVVNKFRGDASLLAEAHRYVQNMTGKPVAGVIDYFTDLGLPEEDSVGFRFCRPTLKESQQLDIAVIHLGHIANFTDFAPFEAEPDTGIRIVRQAADFGEPDLVILPGSKGVALDLQELRRSGLLEKITHTRAYLAGICGGLQILGQTLLDPEAVEPSYGEVACAGLLPVTTIMRQAKTLRRTQAVTFDGDAVAGYEIHHGESFCQNRELYRCMLSDDGRELGYETPGIFATYLHGVFDDDIFRRKFLNRLRVRKGWAPRAGGGHYGIEAAINQLAGHVRERLDIKELYRKMGL